MSPINFQRSLFLALVIAPTSTLGGVYKCLDQNQKIFYQDKPCQDLTSAGLSPALSKLAPKENRQHLLWKLVRGDRTLFLMASLSYGTADMYPLPESVMDVFTGAAVLVVAQELDAADAAAVASKGLFPDGPNLEKHVKPATWQKVVSIAKALNIPEDKLTAQKPWLAALTLTNAALKQAGYDDKFSVEKTFIKAAGTLKPIIDAGSLAEQTDFVDGLPGAEQEQILLNTIRALDRNNEDFRSLVEAWKNGDKNALDLAADPTPGALSRVEISLREKQQLRTEALASTIDEITADGRTYFIIVDAKRLAGEKGLIAILQGKGFKAAQI